MAIHEFAPVKYVPLSLLITAHFPRWEKKRFKAATNDALVRSLTISMWIALVVKHTKMLNKVCLFKWAFRWFLFLIFTGPQWSTLESWNVHCGITRSSGSCPINWCMAFGFVRKQTRHCLTDCRTIGCFWLYDMLLLFSRPLTRMMLFNQWKEQVPLASCAC